MTTKIVDDGPTERERWNTYRIDTPEAIRYREILDARFASLFPKGDQEDLRDWVKVLIQWHKENPKDPNLAKLDSMHPEALEFLEQYGKNYKESVWEEPAQTDPERGLCFSNAYRYMEAVNLLHDKHTASGKPEPFEKLVYAEGIIIGSLTIPMLHAWNAEGVDGNIAVDWSLYATKWKKYFGISLTKDELIEVLKIIFPNSGEDLSLGLIFRKDHYNSKVRNYLEEVLKKRNLNKTS